jgi:hypothetical protein
MPAFDALDQHVPDSESFIHCTNGVSARENMTVRRALTNEDEELPTISSLAKLGHLAVETEYHQEKMRAFEDELLAAQVATDLPSQCMLAHTFCVACQAAVRLRVRERQQLARFRMAARTASQPGMEFAITRPPVSARSRHF